MNCSGCGTPLEHIDEPCPNCLPNMAWRPPTYTNPEPTYNCLHPNDKILVEKYRRPLKMGAINQQFFNPCPKQLPVRSERYKRYIRSKPCIVCGKRKDIQAAHQNIYEGVMGSKVSDLQTLPMCIHCHRETDQLPDKLFAAIEIIKNINDFFGSGSRLEESKNRKACKFENVPKKIYTKTGMANKTF